MKETEQIVKDYLEEIDKRVAEAQKTGAIPNRFEYTYNKQRWELTLPRSVMEQKRLMHARNKYLNSEDFEDEMAFVSLLLSYTKVDGHEITMKQIEFAEVEVLKTAYSDGLLVPLFLGGDTGVKNFMKNVIGKDE